MPDVRFPIETNHPCNSPTADRFMHLFLADRVNVLPALQIPLGRRDREDGFSVLDAVNHFRAQEGSGSPMVVGFSAVQFCRRQKHDSGPNNIQASNFRVEMLGAWVLQEADKPEDYDLDMSTLKLDDATGIGKARITGFDKLRNVFDLGAADLSRHPVSSVVVARRGPRAGRAFGLIRRGITKSISPTQLSSSSVFESYL